MARKSVPPLSQEDLELTPGEQFVPSLDDSRLVDLDTQQESPFLRAQKRVSVRRGSIPRKTARRLKVAAIAATVSIFLLVAGRIAYQYGAHSWRFTIDSSDDIEIAGNHNVTRAQLLELFGGDIGRNIFSFLLRRASTRCRRSLGSNPRPSCASCLTAWRSKSKNGVRSHSFASALAYR